MNLEPVIGLEIHVQLKTASKMFCSCANIFGDVPPNSAICPICMGYPGTLPVPNAKAIEWVQKAGAALGCELATSSKFDRKSYFYPDLPKGYQISQYDEPFCGKGALQIVVGGVARTIGITRIHLEEDAAKNIHDGTTNTTLIDFNRAGTPLMEIVTEPDIRTPEEAKLFLQELQRIVRAIEVSDADMEKGQLRCDANISLREVGEKTFHPKTEIKNLNSFRNVERALQYEIGRQTKEWEKSGAPQVLATRGFNADTGVTTAQRTKEEAADYRYFPEPDIPPFTFTPEQLNVIRAAVPELPGALRTRLMKEFGLAEQHAAQLASEPFLASLFEEVVSELQQQDQEQVAVLTKELPDLVKLAANMVLRQLREIIVAQALTRDTLKVTPENLAELVVLLQQGRVAASGVTAVIAEMQRTGGDPDAIIAKLGLEQESGEEALLQYVHDVIAANPDVVAKIKAGKDSALQFLMGQVMAKSKGKANPGVITALLRQQLKL